MSDPLDIGTTLLDGVAKMLEMGKGIYKQTLSFEDDLGVPFPFNKVLAIITGVVGTVVYIVIAVVIAVVFPILVPLITQVMGGLLEIRKDTPREQLELSAAALSEFLGVEISADQLASGKGADNSLAVSKEIGQALYKQLTKEFIPTGEVTPESGETAAQTFSGYGINFATQNAMISTLADAASFHLLEDFRELGVEAAKNLGLGRLQRHALGTLFKQVMEKPYTLQLAKRYRPDRAAFGDCVKAYNAGMMTLEALNLRLAEAGYPDADIAIVQAMAGAHTSAGDVERLQRWSALTQQAAQQKIQQAGIDSLTALEMLTAAQAARADGEVASYADQVGTYYATQKLDEDKFDELMAPLPMTDDEKHYRKLLYGLKRELDESQLTWAEVEKGFINGIVDEDYVERWLASKGFSAEDSMNKLFLLALDSKAASDKAAAAEAKAKAAKAKLPAKTTP